VTKVIDTSAKRVCESSAPRARPDEHTTDVIPLIQRVSSTYFVKYPSLPKFDYASFDHALARIRNGNPSLGERIFEIISVRGISHRHFITKLTQTHSTGIYPIVSQVHGHLHDSFSIYSQIHSFGHLVSDTEPPSLLLELVLGADAANPTRAPHSIY
jgi:hypothetical protein